MTLEIPDLESITIGADPEFFLKNSDGYIPAEVTKISGTKANPMSLPSGGAVQIDGCALEFNIVPARTADEFTQNIQATMKEIRDIVSEDLVFDFSPAVTFGPDVWSVTSSQSKELGCNPDYSAYTMEPKTPPEGSGDKPFRTAAGHIHIGFTKDRDPHDPKHIYDCSILTQALDYYVGAYEGCWAKPNERKKLYGELGSFRPTSYGFEYRVLGNDWVDKPNITRFLFERVRRVVYNTLRGDFYYPITKDQINQVSCPQHLLGIFAYRTEERVLIRKYLKAAFLNDEFYYDSGIRKTYAKDYIDYYYRDVEV